VKFPSGPARAAYGSVLCLAVWGCGSTPPNFTIAVTPTTLEITPGASQSVDVNITPIGGFHEIIAVTVTGLPAGLTLSPASLSLTEDSSQPFMLTAAGTAPAGNATITVTGKSGALNHSATVALTTTPPPQPPDVTTYHYDNARDGLNPKEILLTPDNVNSTGFGKIGFDAVDGVVDAEPLYVANLKIGGKQRNVLYVATEHGSVYAFDADSGDQLWVSSTLGEDETTSDDRGCSAWTPEIGITSTPVIDRKLGANGTVFVVGMSKDASGGYHHRLHGLDLVSGQEVSGSPREIIASAAGKGDGSQNGQLTFDPAQYAERAALLLLNGNIYLEWASFCDHPPYHGWVMAYSESALQQTQILNLTPNGGDGAIWMSGGGPAADTAGNVYVVVGNGSIDESLDAAGFPADGDFGNSILKLSTTAKLSVADYFAPCYSFNENGDDLDLGAGGGMLFPDLTDASGTVRHLIVAAGKDYNVYIADRDNLGKFISSCSVTNNVYQILDGTLGGQVFSTPAFFNDVLYYGASGSALMALPVSSAQIQAPSSESATSFTFPGATPGISANGASAGIVWALESNLNQAAVLHAYDPSDLTHELYNSGQAANSRDSFGNGNKFVTPMTVNGKVYVGTRTGVAIFGLLDPNSTSNLVGFQGRDHLAAH